MYLFSALLLGLVGSLHCLGMCGPLALALPPSGSTRAAYFFGRLSYNLGRVITYMLLGALFGLVGRTFLLAGAQRWLSIAIGVVLLLSVFLGPRLLSAWTPLNPLYRLVATLKKALGLALRRHGPGALFVVGLLNGFLPCGLVYIALAAAAATGHAVGGLFYMAAFGLGTCPLMLLVSLGGQPLQLRLRLNLQRAIPFVLIGLAILFILRGLSLGIPYISPVLAPGAAPCCH